MHLSPKINRICPTKIVFFKAIMYNLIHLASFEIMTTKEHVDSKSTLLSVKVIYNYI
jgi:hypothetical protein